MKHTVTCSVFALVASATALAGASLVSTFDTDAQGWNIISDAEDFTWTDAFGNPGGSVRATDITNGDFWFFSAPAPYLGDKSSSFGQELSWDLYGIQGNQSLTNRADVVLVGGGLQIGINIPVDPENGAWTSWSVTLDTSEDWRLVNSLASATLQTTPATLENMQTVLANLEGLYIRGEYTNGADSAALDNVVLVVAGPCGDVTGDGNVNLADLNLVLAMFGMDTDNGDATGDGTVNLADLNLVLAQFGGNC